MGKFSFWGDTVKALRNSGSASITYFLTVLFSKYKQFWNYNIPFKKLCSNPPQFNEKTDSNLFT